MDGNEIQPQDQVEQTTKLQGGVLTDPQVATSEAGDTDNGAEQVPQETPARVYTQDEWSKRESVKDKEVAELRERVARQNMEYEVNQARIAEEQARKKDWQEVADGDITPDEANQRVQKRYFENIQRIQSQQQQVAAQQLLTRAEQAGKLVAAHEYGAKYGVDPKELLGSRFVADPQSMEELARILGERNKAMSRLPQDSNERFDSGQGGGVGIDLTGKSPMQLAVSAYSSEETKRRQKQKGR